MGCMMGRDVGSHLDVKVDHPYAVQTFGTLLAFAVCFRTNISWSRYWEACTNTQFMWSKWGDAFMQLTGFLNSTLRKFKTDQKKLMWQGCENLLD